MHYSYVHPAIYCLAYQYSALNFIFGHHPRRLGPLALAPHSCVLLFIVNWRMQARQMVCGFLVSSYDIRTHSDTFGGFCKM